MILWRALSLIKILAPQIMIHLTEHSVIRTAFNDLIGGPPGTIFLPEAKNLPILTRLVS